METVGEVSGRVKGQNRGKSQCIGRLKPYLPERIPLAHSNMEWNAVKAIDNSGTRQPGTVLIVDDEMDDIRLTERVVGRVCPKLSIRALHSGEQLICYLEGENGYSDREKNPYPLVIFLDLWLSRMNGFDVLRWLRNHPPHNEIPVIVLTVAGDIGLAQQAYSLGARSFLTKPLSAEEFGNTMRGYKDWVGSGHPAAKLVASH
ncbi:MAG TPA: response regulator [Candidatus Baltobacteraceae bacterium]|nr:response regulator [Candidatus Baltobacteraceae bacterium]